MKKKILLSVISLALILSACKLDSGVYYDDVYTTSSDRQYVAANVNKTTENYNTSDSYDDHAYEEVYEEAIPAYSSSETYTDGNGTTYVTNNYYYNSDDYYDYAYAARIRRFHNSVSFCWNYYDPYFTNLYWYDRCPGSWGVSIYLGYNWCWPSIYYRPYYSCYDYCSYGFSFSWGWTSCRYGGWYRGCWGYGGYAHGYHNGYWNGYHDGFYAGYYHNNYDRNRSFTYGHFNRNSINNGKANDRDYSRGNSPVIASNSGMGGGNYTNSPYANYAGSGVNAGANGRGISPSISFSDRYEALVAAGKTPATSNNYRTNNLNKEPFTLDHRTPNTNNNESNRVNAPTKEPSALDHRTPNANTNNNNARTPYNNRINNFSGDPYSSKAPATNNNRNNTTTKSPATNSSSSSSRSNTPGSSSNYSRPSNNSSSSYSRPSNNSRSSNSSSNRSDYSRPSNNSSSSYSRPSNSSSSSNSSSNRSDYSRPSNSSSSGYSRPSNSSSSSNSSSNRSNYSRPSNSSSSSYSRPSGSSSSRSYSSPSRSYSGSGYSGSGYSGSGRSSGSSYSGGGGSRGNAPRR